MDPSLIDDRFIILPPSVIKELTILEEYNEVIKTIKKGKRKTLFEKNCKNPIIILTK